MSAHPDHTTFDHTTFDDATSIPTTLSNVVALRPDQQPAPARKARKKHAPVEHPVKFDGKPKDSPHYIEPVTGRKFIEAMAEDDELTPAGLRAAILVMGHYTHCEGVARPGEQSIADRLKKQRTTISEALNKVAERGWLQILPTRVGNRNGPNHYVPVLAKAGLRFGKTGQSGDVSVGFSEDDSRVSPVLTVGFSDPSLSAKPDTNLETGTQQKNPEREPGAPEGAVSLDDAEEKELWFRLFWKHYPKKVNEPASRREFTAAIRAGVDFEALMDGLEAYNHSLKGTDTFIANPANWLKDKRWNDRPEPMKPKAARRTYTE